MAGKVPILIASEAGVNARKIAIAATEKVDKTSGIDGFDWRKGILPVRAT